MDTNLSTKNKDDNQPTNNTNNKATKNPNPVTFGISPLTAANRIGKKLFNKLGKKLSTRLNKVTTIQRVTPIGASAMIPWKKNLASKLKIDFLLKFWPKMPIL
jgi:hypothetical protein